MKDEKRPVPLPPVPFPSTVSPEAAIDRDPQSGQAKNDQSLNEGDPSELSDGGAQSTRQTGDNANS